MKVKEFCNNHKDKSYWLCPHIVVNQSITPRQYECGLEFSSPNSIPKELQKKEIDKKWVEDGQYCLIWRNE